MSAIENIEKQIADAEANLRELKETLKQTKLETPDKLLANELHSICCNQNHTDGCGWHYEFKNKKADWNGYSHKEYLGRAKLLMAQCEQMNIDPVQGIKMFRLVRGY